MDIATGQLYVDNLNVNDQHQLLFNIRQVKNLVIGSNKQKTMIMLCGAVPRLLQVLDNDSMSAEILVECAVVLGSLARGGEANRRALVEDGALTVALRGLAHSDLKLVEACLRFLRLIFTSPVAPINALYEDSTIIPHLVQLLSRSLSTQENVASILAHCCKTYDHQLILLQHGSVRALSPLLLSNVPKVQLPALCCFAAMCYENQQVSSAVASASYNGEPLYHHFSCLLARNKPVKMQLAAAKCLSYIRRVGALRPDTDIIPMRALPTLVRMCKKDMSIEERVDGAETLAYLIEEDLDLQWTASFTDHLITTLATYLKITEDQCTKSNIDVTEVSNLKQAAFRVFASLGANDEDIRKKIIETENLMSQIELCLADHNTKVQLAAVRCLHSLSRSVQQLRTSFKDHEVWKPLMELLSSSGNADLLVVASSTLCNLLLEFSPSKEKIVEAGAVDLLCRLTEELNPALRLNGVWGLMNMAFQSRQEIKNQILLKLGNAQLFKLLSDSNVDIIMKTLGLLRNLLSTKPDIDVIMEVHGQDIIAAVTVILEEDHPPGVKEQTLCILANIADGVTAKNFIMSNEDILKKITNYMLHGNVKLQIAATFCISNLVWKDEEGAKERQIKLKDLGVQKLLIQLRNSCDQTLLEK
ncbi:armadillo repeat-containing protein 8-like [Anneissia japonica]|uniref:armadillo repeat-containing protein 8-like n=1 Tax=Anneissia japonica TaxID=1529436 RepID=UPI0014256139|nr:armadillo repeat-containing protein 8-like [Anneissia japonica]